MATKTITKWYFGEEDKAEIKKYSREISMLFKIKGFEPVNDGFFDFFSLYDFDFIPCVQEALVSMAEDDEYECDECDKVVGAIISVYDSTVKVSLQDLEKYVRTNINETTVKDLLIDLIDKKNLISNDFVEFVDTCGSDEIKQKFVNYIMNRS